MMVGRPLSDLFNKERDIPRGQPRLRVEDLTDGGKIKPSSTVVHAGEIVGLAGLVGAGRSELAQLIFGVRKATAGVIEIDGEPVVIHSPREAIDLGIGFLTENRKEQGLFLELAAQKTSPWRRWSATRLGCSTAGRRKPSPMTPSSCLTSACRTPGARRRTVRRQPAEAVNFALGGDWPAHSNPR